MPGSTKPPKRKAGAAPRPGSPEPRAATVESGSPPPVPPFLVVGVGASAGGLEAFSRILHPISAEAPLALVLVQHLSRDHRSLLPELLAAKTELTVVEAQDGQLIQPGHVYVIRPDTQMTVLDGHLRVRPRPNGATGAIDSLFSSMAEHYRDEAVGVILSGSGHDGSSGLCAINAAGGLTFAQAPNEAQIDGMPQAAIATGAVGVVLPAHEIASELMRLAREKRFGRAAAHPDGAPSVAGPIGDDPPSPASSFEESQLRLIFRILLRATGVDFAQYKLPTIWRRIQRRMALHRLGDLPAYVTLLQQSPGEVESLHQDILIHVTGFFREPESFTVLRETVLPAIIADRPAAAPIRAWVPACSSGEEAYSLAITLLEFLEEHPGAPPVIQIFGTDVSQMMVDRARAAVFPESIAGEVTSERLRRFFVKIDGGYRVSTNVRERCVFARQDVTRDPPFSRLDLVLCRNLLIYLGLPLQRRVISVFHYALNPDGFLVLGRSETIGGNADLFSMADSRSRIYRRKPGGGPARKLDFIPPPVFGAEAAPAARQLPPAGASAPVSREIPEDAAHLLLERYAPPVLIVDDDFRLVRAHGGTAPYIEVPAGLATLDVLRIVRGPLAPALGSTLQEARSRGIPSHRKRVRLRSEGKTRVVDLEVIPIGRPDARQYMVLFSEPGAGEGGARERPRKAARGAVGPAADPMVEQLQDQLTATSQHLQSMVQELGAANEELQSANEEILSSNEELQSTNEELDTAREELQSTNEELSTVNDELQARNTELSRANSDLVNLLANVQIAIVIVTSDFKIRHVTPAAERTLNIIPTDVGRPIAHIKPNIRNVDLEAIIREVIDTCTISEREVDDGQGNAYILRIRPYKTTENRVEGAVLALFDVSSALEISRQTGDAIIARVREPILLLESDWRVRRANRAFCEKFQVSREETEGRMVFELGDRQWNLPGLRQLLQEVLPERKNFEGFLVEHDFPGIGHKKMLLDGERIQSGRNGSGVILLIIRDVTNGES
jgi:two-component system CheB/CheR fusion protein